MNSTVLVPFSYFRNGGTRLTKLEREFYNHFRGIECSSKPEHAGLKFKN